MRPLFPVLAIAAAIVALLAGVGIAVYFFVSPAPAVQTRDTENGCLGADEVAEYELIDERDAEDSIIIIVKDNNTRDEKRSFLIDNIFTSYHPVELHPCGVYAVREYNYDYRLGKPLPNYKDELWKYDYDGRGYLLVELYNAERPGIANYSNDFRIDPNERYLVLERGFAGSSDGVYDVVFKDLKTMKNIFVLPVSEVWKNNPDTIPGSSVGFKDWTKDGRYFWADFFGGAPVYAYIRIDTKDWSYDIFLAPPDVLGGDQLNIETGWLTVHPGNIWIGVAELTEEEKEKRRVQGTGTDLYIENLITKERFFVVHTDEPLHYFKPNWLSDTELEYFLPDGERRVYRLPE